MTDICNKNELENEEKCVIICNKNELENENDTEKPKKIRDYYDKQKRRNYNQCYYRLKRQILLAAKKLKTKCDCGCELSVGAIKEHLKTDKHIKLLNKISNCDCDCE
jgi:hypothetical protein